MSSIQLVLIETNLKKNITQFRNTYCNENIPVMCSLIIALYLIDKGKYKLYFLEGKWLQNFLLFHLKETLK